jgi:hypothetical protein
MLTPSYAFPASAPTPTQTRASCANSATAPGAPGNLAKAITPFQTCEMGDEKVQCFVVIEC